MKVVRAMMAVLAAASLGIVTGAIVAAEEGSEGSAPPAVHDPTVPANPVDLGAGERLVLVVGGVFPNPTEAEEALTDFGELQGYYVAPVSQFVGLDRILWAKETDHALVSAFRTEKGAEEFAEVARAAGAAALVTPRLENLGGADVGLGQEAAPDGSGPLTEPIPGVTVP